MKFKSTRCANIWIKPEQLLDRPNSYRLKRERTYTISLSISQSSLPPTKFKPSHKLSEHFNKIRTKLFEQIVNINGKGRKFLNFSPNQHSTVRIIKKYLTEHRNNYSQISILSSHSFRSISNLTRTFNRIETKTRWTINKNKKRSNSHLDTFVSI